MKCPYCGADIDLRPTFEQSFEQVMTRVIVGWARKKRGPEPGQPEPPEPG